MTIDYFKIGERFGVPTMFLCALSWAVYHFGSRALDEVAVPLAHRHMEFLDKTASTTDKVANTMEKLSDNSARISENVTRITEVEAEQTRILKKLDALKAEINSDPP
jgi:hypothetical protein